MGWWLHRGGSRVDRPGTASRRSIDVTRRVRGPHLESVGAVGEAHPAKAALSRLHFEPRPAKTSVMA